MRNSTRNFAVGLTVLVGLGLLVGVILLFTGLPGWFATGYDVKVRLDQSYGLQSGTSVHLKGIRVGMVVDVRFTDSDPTKGVTLTVRIDREYRLPGTTYLVISPVGISGRLYLDLKTGGASASDAEGKAILNEQGEPVHWIPQDRTVYIAGEFQPQNLLPGELTEQLKSLAGLGEAVGPAMSELTKLARNLNELIAPSADGDDGAADGDDGPAGLQKTFANLDRTLEGMAVVFGDPETQKDLAAAIKNLSAASQAAKAAIADIQALTADARSATEEIKQGAAAIGSAGKTASARIDELSERILTETEKVSRLLQTLNKAATKMEQGEGTAGRLLNDPKLYESLVEATGQLSTLVKEMRDLVAQWKESGVGIKLK